MLKDIQKHFEEKWIIFQRNFEVKWTTIEEMIMFKVLQMKFRRKKKKQLA